MWLHLGEYYYKNSHHMSIGLSPFYALYGYHPLSFANVMSGDSKTPRAKILFPRNLGYPLSSQG